LGCLAYTTTIPLGYEATADRPGIAPIRVQTYYEPLYYTVQPGMPAKVVNVIDREDLAVVREEVCRMKEDADAVVVSFHWGVAYRAPAPYQPELAHAVIEAGADLVVGHHAHILQGVEVYQEVPIFYSLSNFVFDRDNPRYGRETMLLTARFGTEGLERVAVRPAIIPLRGDPHPVSPREGKSVKSQLESLSTGMNSRFEWDGDEIEITAVESRPK
jgi:poly-gamma-glutamate capsule biosynthesis protein CapA/YwtB (metallophosphatase superfamily)